jgi:hypothetical protein
MLFRTFDPYIDDYINENTICFICYEIKCNSELLPITLNLQEDYIKFCDCNGFAHNNCLKKWYDKSNKCPICRKDVYKRISIPMIIVNKGEYFYVTFCINFYKNINRIIRYSFICMLICYSIELYRCFLYEKYYE